MDLAFDKAGFSGFFVASKAPTPDASRVSDRDRFFRRSRCVQAVRVQWIASREAVHGPVDGCASVIQARRRASGVTQILFF
ncbi:hypothetical protein J8I87_10565 [Paraburkholderia sp. LEh10]|uniref:hypothetical protein n=1 Tax=Paraburkholderia sp. LEh10 TaxID=2821353 RepID=UPI001AE72920|nr:hypothetical protein [Paraburkholderia sp. LEh10]MBP0590153.1 hypothetical protein [Paraburkholderia sp. LEh10]